MGIKKVPDKILCMVSTSSGVPDPNNVKHGVLRHEIKEDSKTYTDLVSREREVTSPNYEGMLFDNIPMEGCKVGFSTSYSHRTGTHHYHHIIDPRGWRVSITSDHFKDILDNHTIVKGVIQDYKIKYYQDANTIIPCNSEDPIFTNIIETKGDMSERIKGTKIKKKDHKPVMFYCKAKVSNDSAGKEVLLISEPTIHVKDITFVGSLMKYSESNSFFGRSEKTLAIPNIHLNFQDVTLIMDKDYEDYNKVSIRYFEKRPEKSLIKAQSGYNLRDLKTFPEYPDSLKILPANYESLLKRILEGATLRSNDFSVWGAGSFDLDDICNQILSKHADELRECRISSGNLLRSGSRFEISKIIIRHPDGDLEIPYNNIN